jgi:hypothetical protein
MYFATIFVFTLSESCVWNGFQSLNTTCTLHFDAQDLPCLIVFGCRLALVQVIVPVLALVLVLGTGTRTGTGTVTSISTNIITRTNTSTSAGARTGTDTGAGIGNRTSKEGGEVYCNSLSHNHGVWPRTVQTKQIMWKLTPSYQGILYYLDAPRNSQTQIKTPRQQVYFEKSNIDFINTGPGTLVGQSVEFENLNFGLHTTLW